jgi:NAD(P)-dependent dehydrogenase (short-subunit alcohol dehydrogenase family)
MNQPGAAATALVTGAGRRVGRAIAIDLARAGWRIGVHYRRSEAEAAGVVAEIGRDGGSAAAFQADLTRTDQFAPLIRDCAERLGPVTCLINSAAHYDWDNLQSMGLESWETHLDIDLRAPVFLTQAFAALLPETETGNVINLIDQKVWRLNPDFFSYTIAKSALWTATQTMAQALSPRIRVNAIAPGPVLPSHRQSQAEFEVECRDTPLGRGATLEEICAAIRFLLATPSITGQMIAIDGGQHLG